MSPFGMVFSHMGCQRAARDFGRGLGFTLPALYGMSEYAATLPAGPVQGPSSAGTMDLPVLGDMSSFMNVLDKGVDIFAKYNLAKKGKMVVTEPGGKDSPGISPGTPGGNLFGAQSVGRTALTVGGVAAGLLVLWFVLRK